MMTHDEQEARDRRRVTRWLLWPALGFNVFLLIYIFFVDAGTVVGALSGASVALTIWGLVDA